jgi:hypothetical protein
VGLFSPSIADVEAAGFVLNSLTNRLAGLVQVAVPIELTMRKPAAGALTVIVATVVSDVPIATAVPSFTNSTPAPLLTAVATAAKFAFTCEATAGVPAVNVLGMVNCAHACGQASTSKAAERAHIFRNASIFPSSFC